MPETTPLIKAALNLRVGAGFDVYDEPLEYAKLYLDGTMQIWVDAEDSIEL